MSSEKKLIGLSVLVTRPSPAGEALCDEIHHAGGEAIFFPTLDIVPIQTNIALLDQYDWAIFISPQAVYHSPPLSNTIKIAAMGEGTRAALQEKQLAVDAYPGTPSTEGFLTLPEFQHLNGVKIAIIKGEGGRETLRAALISRGAIVTEITVYRRDLPKIDTQPVNARLRNHTVNVVICTSNTGLINLKILLSNAWQVLQNVPLLVISDRQRSKALELGFKIVLLAHDASHSTLLAALTLEKEKIMENLPEETTPENTKTSSCKSKSWYRIGIFFTTSAVIVLIFVFIASFYQLNRANQTHEQQVKTQMNTYVQMMEKQLSQLAEDVKAQAQIINAFRQTQTGHTRDEWRILEAEFLVQLANDKLQLDHNVKQSLLLLQQADQRVRDLNNPNLLPLRKALATDIAALQAISEVDTQGLYLRLSALNDQLDQLPLMNKPTESTPAETPVDNQLPWWKKALHQTWQGLRQIVTVHYNEKGSLPLLMPDQQFFLYQNLHATLEKAMWGLLRQQPAIYQAALKEAEQWTKKYFLPDSPITQNIVTNLIQLQEINIAPTIPSSIESLKAFQEYLSTH